MNKDNRAAYAKAEQHVHRPASGVRPAASSVTVEYATHAWLSCGCGGDYTLRELVALGDDLWCYWHESYAAVTRFSATRREVIQGA